MMKIAELHRALESAADKSLDGKEANVKAAFQVLSRLLADYEDLSVDEFVLKARDGLKKKSKAKKAPSAPAMKLVKTPSVGEPAIAQYLCELEQTQTDSRQFEKVVDRMRKDKSVRVVEAREIAKRFTGSSLTYKSKPEAAKAILQRQMADIRAAGKADHIADIF